MPQATKSSGVRRIKTAKAQTKAKPRPKPMKGKKY